MFLIMHAVPSKRADQVLKATSLLIHPLLFHDTKETHILFMLPCFRTFKTSEDLRLFSRSSLWAESCAKGLLCSILRRYTQEEEWKANWAEGEAVCSVVLRPGSADPIVSSGAKMALQSCPKLGQEQGFQIPPISQLLVKSSLGGDITFGKQLQPAEGNTLVTKSGDGTSQYVYPLGSIRLPHTKIQSVCCSYRQRYTGGRWDFIHFISLSD